jgi:AcrR family transcriptional regulator
MLTRRERIRQATIDEIKTIAREMADEYGTDGVTVNGIAKKMGMTPQAFYSYFKSRDSLMKNLVMDAYRSFLETITHARDEIEEADSAGRIYNIFIAYRQWALDNPSLFALFAARPVHGFAEQEPEIIKEAEKAYGFLQGLIQDAWQQGIIRLPKDARAISNSYAADLNAIKKQRNLKLPLELINLYMGLSALAHGMISVELSGRRVGLLTDPILFYQHQILDYLKRYGIDYQPETG